jgi:curli production assembly/transport component CsgE
MKFTSEKLKLLFVLFLAYNIYPQNQLDSLSTDPGLEIDNLIVNETISKSGVEFYDLFYTGWQDPEGSNGYTIYISEKPSPGRGNLIIVKINDLVVFQRFITPQYDQIVESSSNAIEATQEYLIRYKEIQQELNGDDLSGSGIF